MSLLDKMNSIREDNGGDYQTNELTNLPVGVHTIDKIEAKDVATQSGGFGIGLKITVGGDEYDSYMLHFGQSASGSYTDMDKTMKNFTLYTVSDNKFAETYLDVMTALTEDPCEVTYKELATQMNNSINNYANTVEITEGKNGKKYDRLTLCHGTTAQPTQQEPKEEQTQEATGDTGVGLGGW